MENTGRKYKKKKHLWIGVVQLDAFGRNKSSTACKRDLDRNIELSLGQDFDDDMCKNCIRSISKAR